MKRCAKKTTCIFVDRINTNLPATYRRYDRKKYAVKRKSKAHLGRRKQELGAEAQFVASRIGWIKGVICLLVKDIRT